MQANELDKILAELYQFEPGLRDFEAELRNVIGQMSDLRPDTHFTPDLAARIKTELRQRLSVAASSKKIFTFNIMNKKILMAASAVLGVAVIALLINLARPLSPENSPNKSLSQSLKDSVSPSSVDNPDSGVMRLAAKAFGSLAASSQGNIAQVASSESANFNAGSAVAMDSSVSNIPAAPTLAANIIVVSTPSSGTVGTPTRTFGLGGGGVNASTKMIAPWYNVQYSYQGQTLDLKIESDLVYRRLLGGSNAAKDLAGLVGNFQFSGINLSSFDNLSATNLSLAEDKDKGLLINFDFANDNIYISENWLRWQIPERDACGDNQACWSKFQVKINDVPADTTLIAQADSFLAAHKINLEHFGKPVIDNMWRDNYNIAEDKTNFYIPEYANIIYPLIVEGQEVLDQSGLPTGLRVSFNILQHQVSGLSGLTNYRYEASNYELETDSSRIIKAAEAGGWNSGYYGDGQEVKTLNLDTPRTALVTWWRNTNGTSEELLVPSLVFPVITSDNTYYGAKNIVVPLVKELLDDLENQKSGAVIMPMAR